MVVSKDSNHPAAYGGGNTGDQLHSSSNISLGQALSKGDFAHRPMSIKKFLEPFDPSGLTDEEAREKYAAYKASFIKQQLEEYFEHFKSQAWFREKYHPDLCKDRSSITPSSSFQRRAEIFSQLMSDGLIDGVVLNGSSRTDISRLFDIVAVKLAGGSQEDCNAIAEYAVEMERRRQQQTLISTQQQAPPVNSASTGGSGDQTTRSAIPDNTESADLHDQVKARDDDLSGKRQTGDEAADLPSAKSRTNQSNRRRRVQRSPSASSSNNNSGSSSSSESSSSDDEEEGSQSDTSSASSSSSGSASSSSSDSESSGSSSGDDESLSSQSDNDVDTKSKQRRVRRGSSHNSNESAIRKRLLQRKVDKVRPRDDAIDDDDPTSRSPSKFVAANDSGQPASSPSTTAAPHFDTLKRPLHHTSVLFLPHVPLSIYQNDLNELFATSPYFLRLTLLDPIVLPSIDTTTNDHPNHQLSGGKKQQRSAIGQSTTTEDPSNVCLRRVGWASFQPQHFDGDNSLLTELDLEEVKSDLISQAQSAEAPLELIDCLKWAEVVPHQSADSHERVRPSSQLTSSLLTDNPSRLQSKSLIRRHLVLAARLTHELDKIRGLWQSAGDDQDESITDKEIIKTADCVKDIGGGDNKMDTSTNHDQTGDVGIGEQNGYEGDATKVGSNQQQPVVASNKTATVAVTTATTTVPSPPPVVPVWSTIDPGRDLAQAAEILADMTSSGNPLLAASNSLTDCLVDEGSAEEELLLSGGAVQSLPSFAVNTSLLVDSSTGKQSATSGVDQIEACRLLDRLILYLRIVHSVDFYAPAVYLTEDLMPHPCQLIHVRPSPQDVLKAINGAGDASRVAKHEELSQHHETLFVNQLKRLLRMLVPIKPEECKSIGLRDPEEVVELFVKENTRRKKRKTDVIWVCSLSDKKFRDPIYVRKHIMNKHLDKVETFKKENVHHLYYTTLIQEIVSVSMAFFFNNYLLDPNRPQLPMEPLHPSKLARRRRRQLGETTADTRRQNSSRRNDDGDQSDDDQQQFQDRRAFYQRHDWSSQRPRDGFGGFRGGGGPLNWQQRRFNQPSANATSIFHQAHNLLTAGAGMGYYPGQQQFGYNNQFRRGGGYFGGRGQSYRERGGGDGGFQQQRRGNRRRYIDLDDV